MRKFCCLLKSYNLGLKETSTSLGTHNCVPWHIFYELPMLEVPQHLTGFIETTRRYKNEQQEQVFSTDVQKECILLANASITRDQGVGEPDAFPASGCCSCIASTCDAHQSQSVRLHSTAEFAQGHATGLPQCLRQILRIDLSQWESGLHDAAVSLGWLEVTGAWRVSAQWAFWVVCVASWNNGIQT